MESNVAARPEGYPSSEPSPDAAGRAAASPLSLIDVRIASMLGSRSAEIQALGRLLAICVGCTDRQGQGGCRECPMVAGMKREGIFR